MDINTIDLKGRIIAQELMNEIEKIARFNLNTVDDLIKARKQVADFTKMVKKEGKNWSTSWDGQTRHRSLEKDLKKMQNDLRDAEIELRDRGVGAMKRFSRNPSEYSKNVDEPDIKEVEKIMDEINKNRTRKRGFFFKNDVKVDEPKPKPVKSSPEPKKVVPKQGVLDRTAKKVGYGVMAGGLGYGGYKMYQKKKQNEMYGGY